MWGVAFGVLGVGVVVCGVLGTDVLGFGSGAVALFATDGLAIGGMALGGRAVAWRAAKGGAVLAHDVAVGGPASAALHRRRMRAKTRREHSSKTHGSAAALMLAGIQRAGGWIPLQFLWRSSSS